MCHRVRGDQPLYAALFPAHVGVRSLCGACSRYPALQPRRQSRMCTLCHALQAPLRCTENGGKLRWPCNVRSLGDLMLGCADKGGGLAAAACAGPGGGQRRAAGRCAAVSEVALVWWCAPLQGCCANLRAFGNTGRQQAMSRSHEPRRAHVILFVCRVCVRPQLGQQLPPHRAILLPQAAGAPAATWPGR